MRIIHDPTRHRFRAPVRTDAGSSINPLESEVFTEDEVLSYLRIDPIDTGVEVENLDPDVAEIDFGGTLKVNSVGVSRFLVHANGVKFLHQLRVSEVPEPPNPQTPWTPNYYTNEFRSLVVGLPAGATSMELFTTKNHLTKEYVRNPDLWASAYTDQLVGTVAYKYPALKESGGGILISPRHVLYCQHYHPWAANTGGRGSTPQILRWVLPDGTIVEAEQIAQSDTNPDRPGFNGPTLDLCVGLLDRDVEVLGVPVIPILDYTPQALEANGMPRGDPLKFSLTQGSRSGPEPFNNYPKFHQQMLGLPSTAPSTFEGLPEGAKADFRKVHYYTHGGDSGTPMVSLVNGVVYLTRLISAPDVASNLADINLLLEGAEDYAIELGRLSSHTGITIEDTVPTPPSGYASDFSVDTNGWSGINTTVSRINTDADGSDVPPSDHWLKGESSGADQWTLRMPDVLPSGEYYVEFEMFVEWGNPLAGKTWDAPSTLSTTFVFQAPDSTKVLTILEGKNLYTGKMSVGTDGSYRLLGTSEGDCSGCVGYIKNFHAWAV